MKKFTMLLIALTIGTCSFAAKLGDNAGSLKSLGKTFQSSPTITPKIDPKDITMGYAGQDVSDKNFIA